MDRRNGDVFGRFDVVLLVLRDSKVLRETWYFAPPSEARAWRAQWVERIR